MPLRRTIVTYGRRNQVREVHKDADGWASVFDKDDKEHVFGSSFSSGQDTSSKNTDLSSNMCDSSSCTKTAKNPSRSRKDNQDGKENKQEQFTSQQTRKTTRMYSTSDDNSNSSSEIYVPSRRARPLRDRNISVSAKPPKGKKPTYKRKTRKKHQEKEPDKQVNDQKTELFDASPVQKPHSANYQNHFSEFEEFSLCIEAEEKADEEKPVMVNVPQNLTPHSSACSASPSLHSIQHSTPNIQTSTPQLGREPREDLFRRLTKSSLKKMNASGVLTPHGLRSSRCQFPTPGGNGITLGDISPALSHISRRVSLESDPGDLPMDITENSPYRLVNASAAMSFIATTRRRKTIKQNNHMFNLSSIYSPYLATPASKKDLPKPSAEHDSNAFTCDQQLDRLHVSFSEPQGHQITEENQEAEDLYESAKDCSGVHGESCSGRSPRHDLSRSPRVGSQEQCSRPIRVYDRTHGDDKDTESPKHSVLSNHELSIGSNKHALIRDCAVVLGRLSESVLSRNTQATGSDYDASQSLFDDTDPPSRSYACTTDKSTDYETAEDRSNVKPSNVNLSCSYASIPEESSEEESDEEVFSNERFLSPAPRSALDDIEELDESLKSFRVMTPVKCRSTGRILSPRDKVLLQCGQEEPISFNECIPPAMMKKCVKIGEGVYGEVFRSTRKKNCVALKIIPVEGNFLVNDEPQKTFAEILSEIVISQTLSDLHSGDRYNTPNYVEVHGCSIVKGSYPDSLIKEWDRFHVRKTSENDRPDMFPEEQLFVVFEFAECGCDLEGFKFESLQEAKGVMIQVALSLAVAEAALEFEHRDLHWGNVLVKRTTEKTLQYTIDEEEISVRTYGVKVAIIDFTLSRLEKDGCTVFMDLSKDPTMFEGQGDYQFDIYRLMKEENEDIWEPFHPYTNVLWLHYLADKLLRGKAFANTTTKVHQALCRQFRTLLREALEYQSAMHLSLNCSFFADELISS